MANNDNLKPFEKGKSGNPKGRPRKYISTLVELGYKKSEIDDALMALLALNYEELGEAYKSKTATILEKTIANALQTDLKKGRTTTVDKIIERVHGKARQDISQHITGTPNAMEITIVKNNPTGGEDTSKNDS